MTDRNMKRLIEIIVEDFTEFNELMASKDYSSHILREAEIFAAVAATGSRSIAEAFIEIRQAGKSLKPFALDRTYSPQGRKEVIDHEII